MLRITSAFILAGIVALTIPTLADAVWNANSGSYGGCSFSGYSEEFGSSSTYDDFSQTGRPPNTSCVDLMQVYAYFCDSTYQWVYRESPWVSGVSYAGVSTPYWGYWADRVYGYHWIQEPTGSYSQKINTDAYEALHCT